jgi:hypothetical protein
MVVVAVVEGVVGVDVRRVVDLCVAVGGGEGAMVVVDRFVVVVVAAGGEIVVVVAAEVPVVAVVVVVFSVVGFGVRRAVDLCVAVGGGEGTMVVVDRFVVVVVVVAAGGEIVIVVAAEVPVVAVVVVVFSVMSSSGVTDLRRDKLPSPSNTMVATSAKLARVSPSSSSAEKNPFKIPFSTRELKWRPASKRTSGSTSFAEAKWPKSGFTMVEGGCWSEKE